MNWLEELLPLLLYEGRLVFRQSPYSDASSPEAGRLLHAAFDAYRLDIAGPLIEFDAGTALEAGSLVIRASWALVNHDVPNTEIARWVAMSHRPTTPAHHLSADLVFRFLPQIRKRALAHSATDPLAERIEAVLRQWPLSGVVADLEIGPDRPPEFGGHFGLMQLYAERWANHQNPSWQPDDSLNEHVDLVLTDRARVGSFVGTSRTRRDD
ncbi:hypothetical protein SAMN05444166_7056 [Singulisphaera sp. GP187]|uniref:hypothetical protein n=1 Tax=Singulisphaera sp. GP187 TaxID=1882752 RepID=UPI00092A6993|nr:hypothetical protein [Singulisphaera sp. GP187]SIO62471.1 hypothetical protein SAMN05444166_7056 [Singulisphaera sp. GP187]